MEKNKNGKIIRPSCLKDLTQTINGILGFYEEDKLKTYRVSFVLTNCLNQDA